ncbi:MAG TPA: PAS domain S-box protein [Pyrinomonadaceae bacterium]|nr:PAS domain S-box protein [Pyrinomonadaceae bacterium]
MRDDELAAYWLASIIESADDAIISKTLDGTITSWNKGAERIFGYTAEEVVGRPVTILIPADHMDEEPSILAQLRRGERIEHYETIRVRKDGTLVDISLTVSPIRGPDGTIIGASKIARDITDRKRVEEALRQHEKELTDFFENSTVGLHWVGGDGRILWANRAELDLLGYTRDEYVGHHIAEFHADEPVINDMLNRLSCKETLRNYEARLRCRDGSIRHVLINSNVMWDGERFVHTRCFTRDITERRQAEEDLRESRRQLELLLASEQAARAEAERQRDFSRHVLEGAPVAVGVLEGPDHRFTLVNRYTCELTGIPEEQFIGRTHREVVPDADEVVGPILDRVFATGRSESDEIEIVLPKGRRQLLVTWTALTGGDGRPESVLYLSLDITARKNAEARLRESEARFAKAFNASPLILTISSLKTGKLIEVNETFVEFTGYAREEAIGRSAIELGLWPKPQEREEGLARLRRSEQVRNVECLFRLRDGSEAVGLVSAEQIEIGGEAFVLTVLQDITKRKRAEEALRESEAQLRTLADSIPQLAWMAHADGHIFWYNRRWYDYTGTTPEEMEGWGWQKVHDPEMLPQVLERWRVSLESGEPFEMEFPLKGSDGSFRWFLTRVSPLHDSQGRIVRWLGTNTDVDEQRRASKEREQLLESERQARAQAEVALDLHRSAEERLGLLVEASGVLLGSLSLEAVQPAILDLSRRMISADAYAIWRQKPESGVWHIVSSAGMSEAYDESITSQDEQPRYVLDGPVIAEDVTELSLLATRRELYESEGIKSILVVPLRIHGHASGTLTFYYRRPHKFDKTEVRVASALANLAGSAISTAELYEEQSRMRAVAEAAERRAKLLAEASTLLASSLDYETTLAQVARLAVPDLADWCGVDMLGEGKSINRLAVAHSDPAKVEWAKELQRRYPPDPDDWRGVPNVLRTGEPELYAEISDEMLAAAARDEEHLLIMREIGFTSAMLIPLSVHGETFGAITFVMAESKRRYDATDLAFAEDLGRRAAVAIENARLYSDAQESNRLKDEFLATVSHELRTPLTAMLGWAHMLRAGHLNERSATKALETIERNARSQAQLIDDLLDVSRIITGKLRLDVRAIDPGSFIESAIEAVRPAADAKEIRIQKVMDTGLASVAGDPVRLQQVVWNLLANAIKFTPRGGRVQVRLERVNSHVEIVVSDNGAGIEPEFLPHVFDRFRQADMSTTRHHGGLGLGLSIVRHLVELHGGTVEAESAGEGQGATFVVRLPVVPIYQKEASAARVHPAARETLRSYEYPDRLDGLKVLVVDDEPDTREMLRVGLGQSGARVLTAASTEEALAAIEKESPDLLISDIGMPGEDGYDLIRRVRALPPEDGGRVPAIALTAYARVEDRLQALRAGYQMHVPKPVELGELMVVAASLVRRGD